MNSRKIFILIIMLFVTKVTNAEGETIEYLYRGDGKLSEKIVTRCN